MVLSIFLALKMLPFAFYLLHRSSELFRKMSSVKLIVDSGETGKRVFFL